MSINTDHPIPLTKATVQDIQLELIRRTQFNDFDGRQVVAALQAHRDLWQAVMMDRCCFSNPGKLPSIGLIKLRDLPHNIWNVDTLYVLSPDSKSAHQLAEIAEDWGGMVQIHNDLDDVERSLGGTGQSYAIVSIWWD